MIVQKYLHDLAAWQALSTEQQERIIGRTKFDDIEIDDDVRADNSHVSLNTIVDENGVEHDIFRDNMVFGDAGAGEYGTFYIAYANDPAITELMLHHMFVGKPAGNYDHILDVSTPVTGSLFFVPSLDLLETLADDEITQSPSDGSLRIGSLKGQRSREKHNDRTPHDNNLHRCARADLGQRLATDRRRGGAHRQAQPGRPPGGRRRPVRSATRSRR